jgi:hypothetical protein
LKKDYIEWGLVEKREDGRRAHEIKKGIRIGPDVTAAYSSPYDLPSGANRIEEWKDVAATNSKARVAVVYSALYESDWDDEHSRGFGGGNATRREKTGGFPIVNGNEKRCHGFPH